MNNANIASGQIDSPEAQQLEVSTQLEDRALSLLGSGVQAEAVASALGVSPSRISQLLANKLFADKVTELRYESLQKHNVRDDAYNSLEDKLLKKLDTALPFLIKPESILKAISVVNGAKRRGQDAPASSSGTQNIVNIILPSKIAQQFTTNLDNQVIRAGEQELMTIPSGNLVKQLEDLQASRIAPPTGEASDD